MLRIEDLLDQCEARCAPVHTFFLDPAQQAEAQAALNRLGAHGIFHGGYEEAERRMLFFLPDWMETPPLDEAMSLLILNHRGRDALTHRDFLGALMNQGVRRECIGDILVFPGEAQVLLARTVAGSVASCLTQAGRHPLTSRLAGLSELRPPERTVREICVNIPSTRLDCLVSALFALPRTQAAALIASGSVSVDFLCVTDKGRQVPEGSVLSVRGKGRAKLLGVQGVSRKGRLFVSAEVSQ